jgi:hypothetical protein
MTSPKFYTNTENYPIPKRKRFTILTIDARLFADCPNVFL